MSRKVCQISGLISPSRDGVGDAVMKIHSILRNNAIRSSVITSTDQNKGDDIHCIISSWGTAAYKVIGKYAAKESIEIAILHYPSPRFGRSLFIGLIPFWLRLRGISTVLYLHEFQNYSWLGKIRICSIIVFSEKIITADSGNYAALSKYRFFKKRLALLPTGSSISSKLVNQQSVSRRFSPNDKLAILFFGFVRSGKGLETVVEAFLQNASLRQKYELHILGTLPEICSTKDREILSQIQQSDFIIHHGYLSSEEVNKVFSQIDIFLFPFEDGVTERRSSFMAGMAFGKPVITTTPALPIEGLIDGVNVIYLEELKEEQLKNTLVDMASFGKERLINIGDKAKQWYDARYSDDVFFKKLARTLEINDTDNSPHN